MEVECPSCTRLRAELAEKSAWQEEIRGAIDRSGMGIMRTSQGPIGTMIGYRPEVEEEHDRKTLEVIHENVDLAVEVRDLKKELAEEKRKVEAGIAAIKETPHSITCAAKKYLGGPINSHCDCWKSRALAALTTPSEGGEL